MLQIANITNVKKHTLYCRRETDMSRCFYCHKPLRIPSLQNGYDICYLCRKVFNFKDYLSLRKAKQKILMYSNDNK